MAWMTQSFYYAIGIIMMKGISLLMLPYLTHKLSLVEYGSLESLILLADIGTILFSFGIVDAMYRYVGTSEGKRRQQLVSNCFTLSVIICFIGSGVILLVTPWLLTLMPVEFAWYQIALLLIPTMLDGVIAIPLTLMRMNALAKRFCYLNVIKAFVQATLTVVLLELGYGLDAVLISGAISSLLLTLCLVGYQRGQMGKIGHLADSKQLLSFGVPVLIGAVSIYLVQGADRWFLAHGVGIEELAVYAVATKFTLILGLLMQPYALWWFPTRIPMLQNPDGKQQCADKAILGTNLGIMLGTLLILTAPMAIQWLLPEVYADASVVLVFLLLIAMIKNAGDYMNLGCYCGDSSQAQMWIQAGCALFALIGYSVLTPQWGVLGIVAVLFSAHSLRLIFFYVISQRKQPLPYRHVKWLACLGVSGLMLTLNSILNQWLYHLPTIVLTLPVALMTLVFYLKLNIIDIPVTLLVKLRLKRNPAH
ncbi:lipopolysaccharide biosynthesis protein [Enterovibrio norvegicus FF-33]|uniref:lipopolysaccharide biosynthesis protein n=1 Tax=Enterovibrio norvegicus TaxID=188144 RepID=UPI0002E26DB7|nr:lipopolysaccharide biosynthesis protein [Enterovibrio norvegicus]OEE65959.1 lipopolysaccharide biosynthesis protein [Enterovibrio norvegicus FF-33]